MKTNILFCLLLLITGGKAQENTTLPTTFSLAVDLSPYAMKGLSVKSAIEPLFLPKTEFHLEYFQMTYPEMVILLNKNNSAGWEVKTKGIGFYGDYKLTNRKNNWYAGLGLIHLDETAQNNGMLAPVNSPSNYQLLEYLLRVTYKWYPGNQDRFFVNPYIAMGGRTKIGGDEGDLSLLKGIALGSVYVGYRF